MVIMIGGILTALVLVIVIVASRTVVSRRYWAALPVTFMAVYLLAKILPGVLLAAVESGNPAPVTAHLAWALGMLAGTAIAGVTVHPGSKLPSSPGESSSSELKWLVVLVFLGCVAIVVMFRELGRVPLLLGLAGAFGDSGDLLMHEARRMNTAAHRQGEAEYFGQGYLKQIYQSVAPIAVCALYLAGRELAPRRSMKRVALVLMVVFTIVGALNGQIWVAAQMGILFGATVILARELETSRGGTWRLARLGVVGYLSAIVAIVGFRALQATQGRIGIQSPLQDLADRLYGYPQAALFDHFPTTEPFRFGATWISELGGVLPGLQESFAYEVHSIVYGGGWGFTLAPGIVASSYVNFGFPGVFLTALVFTTMLTIACLWLLRRASPLERSCAIALAVGAGLWLDADIASFVVGPITAGLVLGPVLLRRFLPGHADIPGMVRTIRQQSAPNVAACGHGAAGTPKPMSAGDQD